MKKVLVLMMLLAMGWACGRICDPGASQACPCTTGQSGAQACAADGSKWNACVCRSEESVVEGGSEQTPEPTVEDIWCRTDADCPEGSVCIEPHQCVKRVLPKKEGEICTKDAECTAGLFCDKVCKKPECTSNQECPAGKKCINMTCQSPP